MLNAKHCCWETALVLLLFCSCFAEAQSLKSVEKDFGPPVLWVPKPEVPAVIDGKLDDAAWMKVKPVPLGFAVGGWETPTQKTEAQVLADDKAIYFAVRCFEAHSEQILAAADERLAKVNSGDTVELFLDPGCQKKRDDYFHVLVNPEGRVYHARGRDPQAWKPTLSAGVGKFDGGWTVEVAVPLADLGLQATDIPKVWGLNICRQRPELGVALPKAAVGNARLNPQIRKLDEPEKYRDGEWSAWAHTLAEYCYGDSRPFHVPQRFGHAVLEVGTKAVAPPAKLFEILYKSDFDEGNMGPFKNAVLRDESFRGAGKCLTYPEDGKGSMQFTQGLEDLEDVTLLMTFKMPKNGRLAYFGRDPKGNQCGAERHEVFLTAAEAKARAATKVSEKSNARTGGLEVSLFPNFDLYDTHADKAAWKNWGRLWKAPGSWTMMTGYFAEPTGGHVMYPGTDWAILRTRLGLFRRYPGTLPRPAQGLVPATQNYPQGLAFATTTHSLLIGDLIIFRGTDLEPPERVSGVQVKHRGDRYEVSWSRAKDNTLTAYYRVCAGNEIVAETHRLTADLKTLPDGATISVIAYDLYGNASSPSEPVRTGSQ